MDSTLEPVSDCQLCKKRRVKCDRGQPLCQKCIRRGLECPGYSSQIRWAGGAALRGRLKELQSLVLQTSPKANDTITLMPESIEGFCVQELVDYYDQHVAKYMVWVDTDNNLFRRFIIPLAQTHRVVRLAIVAVSAQHASRNREGATISESTRNEAISTIRAYISDIMHGLTHGNNLDSQAAEWLLASMLVLSSYEMIHSGAFAADFHRKAARSLINTVLISKTYQSPLFLMLKNKFSTYDVFASTTSFDAQNIQDVILPPLDNETTVVDETVLFSGYQRLIHEATLLGRSPEVSQSPLRNWERDFSLARGITLMAAGQLSFQSAGKRRDFIRLVDIHYYAALLYVSACLGLRIDCEAAMVDLLARVDAIEEISECLHNLPWPLFIAGTACYNNKDRQVTIGNLYRTIAEGTGFRQYDGALEFLLALWARDEPDWQVLAREWELADRYLLPY
ncbi:fungal-specific transcription factor domain-containing protein [Mariannaea sp. PMI_226]|nr:fungal-specific transcription factor domain-containing protein [Mariannaea sp. PMI_226]